MKILYTGAETYLGSQEEPAKSLGGYISATQMPFDYEEALFSELTGYAISNNLSETKCISFHNNTKNELKDITILFSQPPGSFCDYEIGLIKPGGDCNSGFFFELIPNSRVKPKYVSFQKIDFTKEIELGSIKPGDFLGVWLHRKINEKKIEVSPLELETLDLTEEHLDMNIEWINAPVLNE